MLTHIHPTLFWFAYEPVSFRGAALPGSASRSSHSLETTKCPEPLCPSQVLPARVRLAVPSEGATPLSSLLRAHAPDPHPPSSSALASFGGSLQVVASPCWMVALPDVISASLFLDAWPPTPASPLVLLPVSSQRTSAFLTS